MFAEFLLFLLVFPRKHTSVGLTVVLGRSSSLFAYRSSALFVWGRYFSVVGPFRYTRVLGESRALLLLILAGSPPWKHGEAR